MTGRALDLWYDLREKRLAPAAILLLVAILGVPLLLLESGGEERPDVPVPAQPANTTTPALGAAGPAAGATSALDSFRGQDPFQPPASSLPGPAGGGPGTGSPPGAPSAGAGAALPSPGFPGVGGATPGASGEPGLGSPPAAGSDPSGGGSSPGPDLDCSDVAGPVRVRSGDPHALDRDRDGVGCERGGGGGARPKPAAPKRPTTFILTVDIRFGERGNERTRRGVKQLTLIPDDRRPLVVFLGVTPDSGEAVFLVDANLSQRGEGGCRPTREMCNFLYLRRDRRRDEHAFLDRRDGKEYSLRLMDIDRVPLRPVVPRALQRRPLARRPPAPVPPPRPFSFRPFLIDQLR